MKLKTVLIALAIVAMTVAAVPASWANTLTFQDVTFNLTNNGSTLTLEIKSSGITAATGGDWFGVNGLAAFQVSSVGTGLTGLSVPFWTNFQNQLSDGGCTSGNVANGACFIRTAGPLGFTAGSAFDFTFTISKTGGTFDITNNSLKVLFTTNGTTNIETGAITGKTGSLLSQNIPGTVPEPTSLLLLGAGLAGIGIWRRKAIKA